ncbi:MAG: cobalt chelatase [Gammaproteobacteria bacterium]|jgi:cobaltochelatase CobT|nr:cobalt chelatase [Gammaproteobacteria bacterium]
MQAKPPNEKAQQQAAELCGAAVRALTGLRELRHRGRSLFLGGQRVHSGAPHSAVDPLQDDFHAQRGAADGIALRLLHSDSELHRRLAPQAAIQRLIFDMLEQLRVETLVSAEHPGMRSNLRQRFRDWSLRFHHDGHADTELGLLIYTIAQVAWSRLSGYPTLAETDDLIEVTRGRIAEFIGKDIAGLRRERLHQAPFAVHALAIARVVDESLLGEPGQDRDAQRIDNEKALSRITLALDFSDESEDSNIATIVTGNSKVLAAQNQLYRVFNREYDRELRAAAQVREAELRQFREHLDTRIFHQGINVPRLARQISQLLATPRRDGWLFGEEEGLIDGRRLSQLVAAPSERRVFRKDQYRFKNDCQLSFLIDCSGSMKNSIDYIAMLVDVFARALDQAEIASEILGFTTGDWNGGRVYQQWQAQGRPQHPGRLNERCHLVFKKAEDGWRKSRRDIAALLKTPYFREGLDGEAVEWACGRLLGRDAERRILLVISDGSPMDSATNLANDEFYLDNHLKHMVEKYDTDAGVEIYGIGVGLSLTPYYRHCLAIDLNESLSNHVFSQILQMIAHARRR